MEPNHLCYWPDGQINAFPCISNWSHQMSSDDHLDKYINNKKGGTFHQKLKALSWQSWFSFSWKRHTFKESKLRLLISFQRVYLMYWVTTWMTDGRISVIVNISFATKYYIITLYFFRSSSSTQAGVILSVLQNQVELFPFLFNFKRLIWKLYVQSVEVNVPIQNLKLFAKKKLNS